MVVFTCNSCGESLQKPKVEKHYTIICKGQKSLTCVDCFKDFRDDEYVAHTKCITEEERYAAKGSIPGGIVKKGEIKQQSWTEMIQSVINSVTKPSKGQKKIFHIMANSVNVPRKKSKFMNFIKSAGGLKLNVSDIESVWHIIEKQKMQGNSDENKLDKIVAEKLTADDEQKPNGNEASLSTKDSKKRKKNKLKSEKENNMNTDENKSVAKNIQNNQEVPKKKKKKSKASEETVDNELNKEKNDQILNGKTEENTNDESPKKKKKKSKSSNESLNNGLTIEEVTKKENDQILNENISDKTEKSANFNEELPKKKKRKSKTTEEKENKEASSTIQVSTENEKTEKEQNKKKNKPKTKENVDMQVSDNVPSENLNNTSESVDVLKKKKRKSQISESTENDNMTTKENNEKPKKKKSKKGVHTENISECNKNSFDNTLKKKRKSKGTEMEQTIDGTPESKKIKKANNDDEDFDKFKNVGITDNEFSFMNKIQEIMKLKLELSLEILQKKVLSAYVKQSGNEITPKILKHFNKKLKKVKTIEISEGQVKLKSC